VFTQLWRNPNCRLCSLYKNAEHVCLMGVGAIPAEIAIYGEGPGRDEDKKGEPFVGMSGRVITKILEDLGIRREDIFMSNVVKCKVTAQTGKPTEEQIHTCTEVYTTWELRRVRPKLIICLGKAALYGITRQKDSIEKLRRTVLKSDGERRIPTVVTYHPALSFHKGKKIVEAIRDDIRWAIETVLGRKITMKVREQKMPKRIPPGKSLYDKYVKMTPTQLDKSIKDYEKEAGISQKDLQRTQALLKSRPKPEIAKPITKLKLSETISHLVDSYLEQACPGSKVRSMRRSSKERKK